MHILEFLAGRRSGRAAVYGLIALSIAFDASAYSHKKSHTTDVATISGQPSTSVNVGGTYSFTPSAQDTAGKPLTFSIQNQPAWASFNSTTGQLSGAPTAAYAGTYSNIVIAATDGIASAALPPFSIAVNQVSNGSATLTWTPPLANTDGSALTNLAGYRIYYGTATNSLNQSVQVANVGISSFTVSNLTSGTWYFGVTAYTTSGLESSLSNVTSKSVQ
jgi:Putative Ig domain